MIDKRRAPTIKTKGAKAQRHRALLAFSSVPRQCPRHDGWTPDRQQRFIAALADTGSIRAAAHAVNMTPEGAYQLRRHAEAASFRKAWEHALSLGVQQLEDIGLERALHGQQVPVYSYGKLIGTRTVYNDRLLMFYLRNRAPARFTADGRGQPARSGGIGDPQHAAQLSSLKQKWRKEWEAELAERAAKRSEDVTAQIDAKLSRMRANRMAAMRPETRAAYDQYCQLTEQDRAAGYRPALPEGEGEAEGEEGEENAD